MSKENIIGKEIKLLDHGFIRVIDCMGDDSAIVQAARVSYGDGTKTVNQDEGLIRYLLRHRHTSPFEMCEIKLHLKMPIFIARQWIRHRTASLNEISARYSVMKEEFYIPEKEDICQQATFNKQGRETVFENEDAVNIQTNLRDLSTYTYSEYEKLLEQNLARELARTVLPVSLYTEMYWKIDLHNLLHFLALRNHPHAQKEIRVYAEAMTDLLKDWVPIVHKAFIDYRVGAISFSNAEKEKLRNLFDETKVREFFESQKDAKGEKKEFIDKIKDIMNLLNC